ncbi:low-complexity tail membrane protein [Nodosilinea sp. E11]|uniref:low-complexity tail membrane protein n=1 Tax=Nodosilinea sp. E11 TaxID=3037479 RepID=UPI00293507EB|nr:low-complexity tail membrane protein [Nodosilinea sp. E11]WOD37634.1 low-complexity tail membrane protein [Nodosilinea sp. E11]
MKPWRCDPYLWVHLAGLATVPLWIDLCLMGLAVGNPTLPGLELGFMVLLGVLPVLSMQLRRPFYIFSLPGLALRPSVLQADQRRLLSQFRQWRVRWGALVVPIPLVWVLVKLYPLAFLARDLTPFGDWGRVGGVAIAALSFFMANLFLQVPVAVLQVLATPDRNLQKVLPYPTDKIAADFSWLGLSVGQILPVIAPPASDQSASMGDAAVVGKSTVDGAIAQAISAEGDLNPRPPEESLLPEKLPEAMTLHPKVIHPEAIHPEALHPEVSDADIIHPLQGRLGWQHPENDDLTTDSAEHDVMAMEDCPQPTEKTLLPDAGALSVPVHSSIKDRRG